MPHHYLVQTVFSACMSLVFFGVARADLVQCVDQAGIITYTDVPCKDAADAARAAAWNNPSTSGATISSSPRTSSAPGEMRDTTWMQNRARNYRTAYQTAHQITRQAARQISPDRATVAAARYSLLLMDQAALLLHQKKLAALDQKETHWYKF